MLGGCALVLLRGSLAANAAAGFHWTHWQHVRVMQARPDKYPVYYRL